MSNARITTFLCSAIAGLSISLYSIQPQVYGIDITEIENDTFVETAPLIEEGMEITCEVNAAILYSHGDVQFKYSEPPWSSKLNYPLDGYLVEVSAKTKLQFPLGRSSASVAIRGSIAQDISVKGDVTDSDYQYDYRWGYSEHDGKADVSIWDIDCLFSVRPFTWSDSDIVKSMEAGMIIGYGEQSFDFLVTDGWGRYYNQEENFSGHIATYDTTFSGFRLGPYFQCQPIPELSLRIEAILIPNLEANSDAYWILREYRFWQIADGTGTSIGIMGTYKIIDHLYVFAGFRWVCLDADENGRESGVEGDYSYTDLPIVPYISAEYSSLQFGLRADF